MKTYKRTNPYSKQSEMLTVKEAQLYDLIKQNEEDENYTDMQKAIDKFSRLNPKAYRVLVD
jgi:transposase-like protein